MRRPELDNILTTMLDSQPEVSDLLFTVDKPPQVESFGELKSVTLDPAIRLLFTHMDPYVFRPRFLSRIVNAVMVVVSVSLIITSVGAERFAPRVGPMWSRSVRR